MKNLFINVLDSLIIQFYILTILSIACMIYSNNYIN